MFLPALLTLLIYGSRGSPLLQPIVAVVALNGTTQFSCTTPAGVHVERWLIYPSGSSVPFFWPYDTDVLQSRGISVTSSTAELHVSGNSVNNGTQVRCVDTSDAESQPAKLQVYARPSAPTNLRLAVIGDRHLRLSWNAPFVPYQVNVSYTVLVTLNTKEVFKSNRTYDEYYEYFHAFGPECQNYQFSVVAENDAGISDPSNSIVTTIPIVPQLTPSVLPKATLTRDNGYTVHISTEVARTCLSSPVSAYYLQLQNAVTHSVISVGPVSPSSNDTIVDIVIDASDGLQPDTKYVYTITAVNVAGNSSTLAQAVYTTDVQSSTITGSDHQLNVTCFFAEGTLAKGCVVCLEKSGEVVYQMIPRVNGTAKGVIRTEFSVDCYNISVMDWEEDGSMGLLSVPVSGVWNDEQCTIPVAASRGTLNMARVPLLVAMVVGLLGGAIALVVFALVSLVVCRSVYVRRTTKRKSAISERDSHSPPSLIGDNPRGTLSPHTLLQNRIQTKVTTPTHSTTSSIEVTVDGSSLLPVSQVAMDSPRLSKQAGAGPQ